MIIKLMNHIRKLREKLKFKNIKYKNYKIL